MAVETVRVLLLGVGNMARRHLDGYRRIDGVTVVGAVGRGEEHGALFTAETGIACLTDRDEALRRFTPQAVSICTPTETHAELAVWALRNGLHVLVEKPLAATRADARLLRATLRRLSSPPVAMVAHTETFSPPQIALGRAVRQGGGPTTAVSVRTFGNGRLPANVPPPEQWSAAERRKRVFDLLTHLLSQAVDFLPSELVANLARGQVRGLRTLRYDDTPGAEAALVRLDLPGVALRVSLDNRAGDALVKEVVVHAGAGAYRWLHHNGLDDVRVRSAEVETSTRILGEALPRPDLDDPFRGQIRAFIEAVRRGDSDPPQSFTKGAAVVHLALEAVRRGVLCNDPRRQPLELLMRQKKAEPLDAFLAASIHEPRHGQVAAWLRAGLAVADPGQDRNAAADRVGRFLALMQGLAAVTTLKPYHARFLWRHSQDPEDPINRPDAREALLYSGRFSPQAVLRLDTRCNQRCLFCNVGGEAHEGLFVATDAAKQFISRLPEQDIFRLTFSGGEPTLRPDLAELIDYARRSGIDEVDLQTNAMLLGEGPSALLLRDAGLDNAQVSLHSHIPKLSDYLTACPGGWGRTLWGIRRLGEAGVSLRIIHVLTTANYKLLPDFIRFIDEKLPWVRDVDVLLDQHAGRGRQHPFLVARLSEIEPFLHDALDEADRRSLHVNNALTIPPCFMGTHWRNTLEYQRMTAISRLDLIPGDAETILNQDKVKGPQCAACLLHAACRGVWKGYALLYGVEELTPLTDDHA